MEAMERMSQARAKWHHMDQDERGEAAHGAIDIAVIVLEEAFLSGKITKAGMDSALTLLGVACANQHE